MKKFAQVMLSLMALMIATQFSFAQTQLAPDQNPNYLVSQNKYMGIADSLTGNQSTTIQDTYKAIDYLEDKKEARAIRRTYRQQRQNNYWGNNAWDYNNNYCPFYGNNYGYYNNYNSWSGRPYLNNFLFNTLPLAVTLGSWHHRRWWR